jgi:group I intron endonuclease
MKQKIACVYLIENLMNGKKYIGQTVDFENRKRCHKCNHTKKNYHIYLAMRKYGYENFEYSILMKDKTINYDKLDFWECYFIELFDTLNRTKGYNNDSGGNLNKVCSEEKKKKLSEANKGQIRSDESRLKMSISQKGKIGVLNNSYGLIRSNQTKEKCGMGTGPLFKEILKDGKPSYITTFGSKTITISIKKYPNLGKPLVIMKRLCMENDINFQPTLINDMLNFVQNFDLKTIINLD